MQFNGEKSIYIQISEYVMEKILTDLWLADQKIPSIRDLAAELEVNPNTVMRGYDLLQQQEIIYNKRGLGFFVAAQGKAHITLIKKKQFLEIDLPAFFNTIALLGISIEDINLYYQKQQ